MVSVTNEVVMEVAKTPEEETLSMLKENISLIQKLESTNEGAFMSRALRNLPLIRKSLSASIISKAIEGEKEKGSKNLNNLQLFVSKGAAVDAIFTDKLNATEAYLSLISLIALLDDKKFELAGVFGRKVIEKCHSANSRVLDGILAKLFYFTSICYENEKKHAELRTLLLSSQRTAVLRQDHETLAVIINGLLRNYLSCNLVSQAEKLVSKSSYPENVSNSQLARYLYYLGRIKAIQLDYSASFDYLIQATRKAPQNHASIGFQQAVTKLSVIVQLLMGEIPQRALFNQSSLKKSLIPYFNLAKAVRNGDLVQFQQTIAQFKDAFSKDCVSSLIMRLRHNVIKAAIKLISLSYSKISLEDVRKKLSLDSKEDAEYIVAKAIKDGVINASIDHSAGFVKTKELYDVYATTEPQEAFNQRINFCLGLHNETVKALRYPSKPTNDSSLDEIRIQREELQKELESELNDQDDVMDF